MNLDGRPWAIPWNEHPLEETIMGGQARSALDHGFHVAFDQRASRVEIAATHQEVEVYTQSRRAFGVQAAGKSSGLEQNNRYVLLDQVSEMALQPLLVDHIAPDPPVRMLLEKGLGFGGQLREQIRFPDVVVDQREQGLAGGAGLGQQIQRCDDRLPMDRGK